MLGHARLTTGSTQSLRIWRREPQCGARRLCDQSRVTHGFVAMAIGRGHTVNSSL
jgi:hypothetical protein